jgi:hypothetical protein
MRLPVYKKKLLLYIWIVHAVVWGPIHVRNVLSLVAVVIHPVNLNHAHLSHTTIWVARYKPALSVMFCALNIYYLSVSSRNLLDSRDNTKHVICYRNLNAVVGKQPRKSLMKLRIVKIRLAKLMLLSADIA